MICDYKNMKTYIKRKILKTEKEVPRKVQILRKRNKIKIKKIYK